MAKKTQQLEHVDCRYGAPMGRQDSHVDNGEAWHLFKVRLDRDGYDDGGAYWGLRLRPGEALYCAEQIGKDGGRHFVDAASRADALAKLSDLVPADRLLRRVAQV